MSQNFNFNGPSHDSHGSADPNIEGLSHSLIYPGRSTPAQQNYSRAWPGAQNWQSQRQESYNYGMPYQAQGLDTGNYFSSHQQQEYVPFEDGEGLYQNENGNTHLGLGQNAQASKQNSLTGISTPHDQLHTRLHDLIKHQAQPRPAAKFEEQERASHAASDGTNQKSDVSALNDRAAELRARLLANRSSTPGTPSNQTAKSSDTIKMKTNDANSSQRQVTDSNSTEAPAMKIAGHTTIKSLGGTKMTDKSPNKAPTTSSERGNSTTDIDGLLAEARAAVAAEKPKPSEKTGQGGSTATNLKENVNDSLSKGTTSEGAQHATKVEGPRHSQNKSTSSSETSELGEIRSDSGKNSSATQPSEPVSGKASKEGGRPFDEKSKHQTHMSNGLEKQPIKRVDGDAQNKQAHPASSAKPSASSPTASQVRDQSQLRDQSHQRDQSQSSRNDYRRDRYERPSLTQEPRKEPEQERRREPDLKERNTDSRRPSNFRTYGNDSERARTDYQVDTEPRRPQIVRYDVQESARAAAEYKKELEDRRRHASRASFDRAEPAKDPSKKEVDAVGPRTPKARVVEPSPLGANSHSNTRTLNTRSGESATKSSRGEAQGSNNDEEDVRDWLEMTEFADLAYRKTALARFRKIRQLDAERAELEREAQLESERRSYIVRSQSTIPRESVEASGSQANISPKVIRTSIQSMPPPPVPLKDGADDIGIKIKDSANREGPLAIRTAEDETRASRKAHEQIKPRITNLKRPYVDDDSDARNGRPAEKLTRLDTRAASTDYKTDTSPTTSRGQWSLENRISRNEYERVRSRSPVSRNRSMSPIRGRTSNYDKYEKYVRPRSRGSPVRRNEYSPERQATIEKPKSIDNQWCWQCQRSGHLPRDCTVARKRRDFDAIDASSYEDSHSSPYAHKAGDVKMENEHEGQYLGDYQASTMRPYTGPYQPYYSSNYRGRGRGRGGYAFANSRGGYSRPYRPIEGVQDTQVSGGSASLNLRAGDSRYFMIKSWNSENVEIAQRD
ncbi:hypothetical protein MMC07_004666, partial [Pseudocyphellaria aurata]|nr:hypothetical protein [Pseudocyphellaria aurata]